MRVLIHQQFHLGHHFQYLEHLLPLLTPLVDSVNVAITEEGRHSPEYAAFLRKFETSVTFEPVLPKASPWVPMNERWSIHRNLRDAVRRSKPDYVLIPSGDAQATAMSVFRWTGLGGLPGRPHSEAGIHFGVGSAALNLRTAARDYINQLNLGQSGLHRVHLVNLLFYEQVCRRGGVLARLSTLMPHPVAPNPCLSREESRARLGIPTSGRYIGLAASIESRKAIREFLSAFRSATTSPEDRVLLAGWVSPSHLQTIATEYGELVKSQRLIVMNGFLEQATFQTALTALDVVCAPYPGFAGLSSTLLEAVAAERPVLANDYGWSRAIIRRFQVGWTCDVLNPIDFAAAIRVALEECLTPRDSEAVRRLRAFHHPNNFAESWVQGIRALSGLPASTSFRGWEWVNEALSEHQRYLN